MPKICEECGEEIKNENAKFCDKCGAKIKVTPKVEDKKKIILILNQWIKINS